MMTWLTPLRFSTINTSPLTLACSTLHPILWNASPRRLMKSYLLFLLDKNRSLFEMNTISLVGGVHSESNASWGLPLVCCIISGGSFLILIKYNNGLSISSDEIVNVGFQEGRICLDIPSWQEMHRWLDSVLTIYSRAHPLITYLYFWLSSMIVCYFLPYSTGKFKLICFSWKNRCVK